MQSASKRARLTSSNSSSSKPSSGVKKLVVKSLKKAPTLPADFAETTWKKLGDAIDGIHRETSISWSLEELYKAVEDMCANKLSESLYGQLKSLLAAKVEDTKALVEQQLQPVGDNANDIDAEQSVSFLSFLLKKWHKHCQDIGLIRSIFLFLDRTYVLQTNNVLSIFDLFLYFFRKKVVEDPRIQRHLIKGIVTLVRRDRENELIDSSLLSSALSMLSTLSVYKEIFEPSLLQETEAFYNQHSLSWTQNLNVSQYLHKVKEKLEAEKQRCISFFEQRSVSPIMRIVDSALLTEKSSFLIEKGFSNMIHSWNFDDLHLLYAMLDRKNVMKTEQLKDAWAKESFSIGEEVVGKGVPQGPSVIVSLLSLMDHLNYCVFFCFAKNKLFANALKDSSQKFLNLKSNQVAQFLARHVNSLLSVGASKRLSQLVPADSEKISKEMATDDITHSNEIEAALKNCISLFRFLNSKDVFEAFFKKDLSKRLLLGKSESTDNEQTMLRLLKEECGPQYTQKLEGMFKDIALAEELMSKFSETSECQKMSLDLKVSVLTQSFWPPYAESSCKLPNEVSLALDVFQTFYKTAHSGRRLAFQHSLGHCLLKALFRPGCRKELSVSQFQACVLLLFNAPPKDEEASSLQLSFVDIQEESGIEPAALARTLYSLSQGKTKVLIKTTIENKDQYAVNVQFKHKLHRIKINAVQMKETPEEEQKTKEKVFKDRQYLIDAAIVRIMKTKKKLQLEALIAEIYKQIKFQCQPSDIKKRIESLIERDYLERMKDDRSVFAYLA